MLTNKAVPTSPLTPVGLLIHATLSFAIDVTLLISGCGAVQCVYKTKFKNKEGINK